MCEGWMGLWRRQAVCVRNPRGTASKNTVPYSTSGISQIMSTHYPCTFLWTLQSFSQSEALLVKSCTTGNKQEMEPKETNRTLCWMKLAESKPGGDFSSLSLSRQLLFWLLNNVTWSHYLGTGRVVSWITNEELHFCILDPEALQEQASTVGSCRLWGNHAPTCWSGHCELNFIPSTLSNGKKKILYIYIYILIYIYNFGSV